MSNTGSDNIRFDTALYLCRLIRCAFEEELIPDPPPEGVSLRQVYTLAKHNSVESIAYYGFIKGNFPTDDILMKKWRESLNTVIFRTACYDAERESLLSEMKNAGLSYLPLKGIRLTELYPYPGMRSMADNDILFGFTEKDSDGKFRLSRSKSMEEASAVLKEIMLSGGFTLDSTTDKDDIYHKAPIYNFEMHKSLVSSDDPFFSYYEDPWIKAVPSDEYGFTFSPEDDYIFYITHMYKHFSSAGCGIRHIVDLFVILRLGDSIKNHSYIKKELESLGLSSFNDTMVSFMDEIFLSDGDLCDSSRELLMFLTGCGTFGNLDGYIHNNIKKAEELTGGKTEKAKFLYIMRRIFPSRNDCKKHYPFFYKHPYMLPFLYIFRIGRGIIFKFGRIMGEFSSVIFKK